ncbi:MAG TPA: hypothetical protein DCL44_04885 [Elusimicrobia bacterium]|nr:hypothetical protein [Elusimicrobiota bacterium]
MKKPFIASYNFNFVKKGRNILISNEFGGWSLIGEADFKKLAAGRLLHGSLARELSEKGFAANRMDMKGMALGLSKTLFGGWKGPHVHIISLTQRCNQACAYCCASAGHGGGGMSRKTAAKTLDFIFSIPCGDLVMEFQGGEPLLNFSVLRFMVNSARRRAVAQGRRVHFSVVTNLTAMTAAKLEFLVLNGVTICTSLDGPASLHDANRRLAGRGTHALVTAWLKKTRVAAKKYPGFEPPNAISTITRASLAQPERIVDEFIRQGIRRVQLGPLDPLGRAAGGWGALGFSAAEFLAFYSRALDYMLALNRRGNPVYEKGAVMFLKEIFGFGRPRYQNLDIFYRLAYNIDGGVYGSDEARMLANSGDDSFRLGSVQRDSFKRLIKKPTTRLLLLSAFPQLTQSACARCPYSVWCRVSPAHNWAAQGSFWGDMMTSQRCAIFKGVFDLLLSRLSDRAAGPVLRHWSEFEP